MLEHNGLIEIWDQGNIQAGIEWEEKLKTHLDQAEMILLFINVGVFAFSESVGKREI